MHHTNTSHFNRGQGFRGGFQRGRRPGYGDYHNRERNYGTLELSQRVRYPTGPSDVYRHSGDTPSPSEVGSNDQHQHEHQGGDTMNGVEPDEGHQQHSRESSPYEPVAETSDVSPENLNAGSDYGEGSRHANHSMAMNPLRPESDEHHWEDTYDQDNRVGDVSSKGDDQTRPGVVLNQIDVVNPWT